MLAGRYPSEEFAGLRPRLVWDRMTGTLRGRPGGQRLAVTNGGTIPDRGLFGVFLAGGQPDESGRHSRRVGELDEEMVYESRVGDVFVLGASSWRIEDITADQVLVSPAPGQPGRLPFWHGDAPGRPAELGRGDRARTAGSSARPARGPAAARLARRRPGRPGRGEPAPYLAEQREATGYLPDDRTLVMERFRDELGDWRLVLHSPYGAQVHAPWALAIAARLRERYGGMDVQALHTDDGIVIRVPDADDPPPAGIADARPGRGRAAGHRRARRVRAVRVQVPGVRGPRAAAAPAAARPPDAAVAAAAALRPAAGGGQPVRHVPDRAGDGARVPAGRLRRAGPDRR